MIKALMVCMELEPGAAGLNAQTNPLSYGGTPKVLLTTQKYFTIAQIGCTIVVFTLASFFCCILARSIGYEECFAFTKRNSLLRKTNQRERCFGRSLIEAHVSLDPRSQFCS